MITIKYVVIKKTLLQSGIVLFMPGIPFSVLNVQSALIHCWILQMMDLVLTFDNLMKRQILFLLPAHWIMVTFKIFICQMWVLWLYLPFLLIIIGELQVCCANRKPTITNTPIPKCTDNVGKECLPVHKCDLDSTILTSSDPSSLINITENGIVVLYLETSTSFITIYQHRF